MLKYQHLAKVHEKRLDKSLCIGISYSGNQYITIDNILSSNPTMDYIYSMKKVELNGINRK